MKHAPELADTTAKTQTRAQNTGLIMFIRCELCVGSGRFCELFVVAQLPFHFCMTCGLLLPGGGFLAKNPNRCSAQATGGTALPTPPAAARGYIYEVKRGVYCARVRSRFQAPRWYHRYWFRSNFSGDALWPPSRLSSSISPLKLLCHLMGWNFGSNGYSRCVRTGLGGGEPLLITGCM